MKKVRLFLGAMAFVFAFVTAFAFKAAPLAVVPAYVDEEGACAPIAVSCTGDEIPCRKNVGGTLTDIFDKQTGECQELQMNIN